MRSRQLFILLGIATLFILAGAVFKLMHWPGANIALGIGLLFQSGVIIYAIAKSMNKKP